MSPDYFVTDVSDRSQQALTTGSCGRRGQRAMFPDTFVAGAAHPDRYVPKELAPTTWLAK
jgi:hypothetical protein